jgi:hypothetical protein
MGIIFIEVAQLGRFKDGHLPFWGMPKLQDPFITNFSVHYPQENTVLSASAFEQALRDKYQQMPSHMQAMVSWEYYWQQAQKNQQQIREQLSAAQKPALTPLPNPQHYDKTCCLRVFNASNSLLLWDIYADTATTIGVELDTRQAYFTDKQYAAAPQIWAPVEYGAARPEIPKKDQPFPALLKRAPDYAFEKEWRLIRPVPAGSMEEVLYFPFPYGLIKSIYLQVQDSPAAQTKLLDWLSQDLNFRRVPVYRLDLHAEDLAFNPQRLR